MKLNHFLAALLFLPLGLPAQQPAPKPVPPPLLSHEIHNDHAVTFRLFEPNAAKVELSLEGVAKPIPMLRDSEGVWSFTTQPLSPEIYEYNFVVDDHSRTDPENHNLWPNIAFPPGNYVEIPGPAPQPWDETAVPHGTLHTHFFTSKVAIGLPANQEQVMVYTPPGYDPHAKKPYPVLYLLHGWSGEAGDWTSLGRANFILDNLLAQGRIKPMVVVMPTGYGDISFVQNGFNIWDNPEPVEHNTQLFMQMFVTEIMPQVEASYNVSRDRDGRAITGLSMGGLEALDTGLHHTDQFAWIGGFSAAVHNLDYEHQLANLDPKTANLRLLWIACGTEDSLIKANRRISSFLKSKNLPVTEIETPGLHVWTVWRDNLINFTSLLFR
jgi:enterochelin esterase family protein